MHHDQLKKSILEKYGSQSRFAAAAGLDTSTVSAIVNGRLIPYPQQIAKMKRALGIPQELPLFTDGAPKRQMVNYDYTPDFFELDVGPSFCPGPEDYCVSGEDE